MLAISAAELTSIRAEAEAAALDKSCVIKRNVRAPEPQGGASLTPTVIETVMAGMAQPTAGQLTNYGYLVGDKAAWQVKFSLSTTVLEQDELTIEGQNLSVVKLLSPRSIPVLLTVLAVEVV